MTDAVIIALINTAGLVVIGIGVAYINKKATAIHTDINGKMKQLLEVTSIKERAEGVLEGVDKQKSESASTAAETVQAIIDSPDITTTKT